MKQEQAQEDREKMQLLVSQFTEDQLDRYAMYRQDEERFFFGLFQYRKVNRKLHKVGNLYELSRIVSSIKWPTQTEKLH